jgi:hypothetical protein
MRDFAATHPIFETPVMYHKCLLWSQGVQGRLFCLKRLLGYIESTAKNSYRDIELSMQLMYKHFYLLSAQRFLNGFLTIWSIENLLVSFRCSSFALLLIKFYITVVSFLGSTSLALIIVALIAGICIGGAVAACVIATFLKPIYIVLIAWLISYVNRERANKFFEYLALSIIIHVGLEGNRP